MCVCRQEGSVHTNHQLIDECPWVRCTVSAPVNVSQMLAPRPSSLYAPSTW